jgi:ATP-dependent DNA helicase RecG
MLLQTVASGYQAAFMAPTELLAEQHYQQCERWFKPLSVRIVFLTGKLGFPERQEALSRIANGEADIIVGTHALFQQEVSFHQLALVCIDEQHRFGVKQRAALFDKGNLNARVAHQLVMTATPIPRTLALVQYADLDYSVLDELPPGRIPIQSAVLSNTRRGAVIKRVHELCQKGKQVYWVCPLIESSETLQAENVAAIAAELQTVLSDCCIGFIHGRLSSEEKNQTMRAFNKGAVDVLVATTVIEVGVDVPNAVLMVIENAERMGLAQLHQLRGRVVRGRDPSFCIFLYQTPLSIPAKERLAVLRESQDGFHIAERDLALRGSGDLLGTRQAGAGGWRIANPVRDSHWLIAATQIADNLLKEDSSLAERLEGRWYQKAAAGSKTG